MVRYSLNDYKNCIINKNTIGCDGAAGLVLSKFSSGEKGLVASGSPEILFIVDDGNKLEGAITKGDLFNWFGEYSADAKLEEIMNKTPRTILDTDPEAEAEKIFRGSMNIHILPVVDKTGELLFFISRNLNLNRAFSYRDAKEFYTDVDYWHLATARKNANYTETTRSFVLDFINNNFDKDAKILNVACGMGWLDFELAEYGFNNLHAFDIDSKLVGKAQALAKTKNYNINFWVDDAFNPTNVSDDFDVIIMMQWIYAAFNSYKRFNGKEGTLVEALDKMLTDFYKLKQGSFLFLDILDDLSNYSGDKLFNLRGFETATFEEVNRVFAKHSYKIIDKCFSAGRMIRVLYILQKTDGLA